VTDGSSRIINILQWYAPGVFIVEQANAHVKCIPSGDVPPNTYPAAGINMCFPFLPVNIAPDKLSILLYFLVHLIVVYFNNSSHWYFVGIWNL